MDQVELFLVFTRPLEQAGINYMVTGSVVSMLYVSIWMLYPTGPIALAFRIS